MKNFKFTVKDGDYTYDAVTKGYTFFNLEFDETNLNAALTTFLGYVADGDEFYVHFKQVKKEGKNK